MIGKRELSGDSRDSVAYVGSIQKTQDFTADFKDKCGSSKGSRRMGSEVIYYPSAGGTTCLPGKKRDQHRDDRKPRARKKAFGRILFSYVRWRARGACRKF